MATRFEMVLCGEDESMLRAAGEEAIREIQRIEGKLSYFRHNSTLSRLNRRAGEEPVSVDAEIFAFLKQVAGLSRNTRGGFDPTIGPLMTIWGLRGGAAARPDEEEIRSVLKRTGMDLVRFSDADRTVRFATPGVLLDPGAVGKGYAIDQISHLLRETGVRHALIHGGTSTVSAWGKPPDGECWKVAVRDPATPDGGEEELLKVYTLQDKAMSVSTILGKTSDVEGTKAGHVLDPRTGHPVDDTLLAACTAESATMADCYSTAMLVLGRDTPAVAESMHGCFEYFVLMNDRTVIEGSCQPATGTDS